MKCVMACLAIFASNQIAYAQVGTLVQVTPKSPNVAGFQKFSEIPVGLGTGSLDLNIPIYEIQVGSVNIPISFSYNNNGLKCDEIPSWVGLGWNLSTGGYISYQQNGFNDFDPIKGLFPYGKTALNRYFNNQMTPIEKQYFWEDIIAGNIDSEYDQFNYNFGRNTGSFHFLDPSTTRTSPKSDLKITKTGSGFKIIDDLGNAYFFESPELIIAVNPVDVSTDFSDNSCYYISKIITTENKIINFKYKTYHLQYETSTSQVTYGSASHLDCPNPGVEQFANLTTIYYALPDEIEFPSGKVKFVHSNEIRADLLKIDANTNVPFLKGIEIYNVEGKVKEFAFTMSYFGSERRLKLDAVSEISDGVISNKWLLDYYNRPFDFPSIFSKERDHWGYYNGVSSANPIPKADYSSFIPYYSNYYVPAAIKTSNFDYSKLGMLKSIVYPTGGKSEFEYEQNQFKLKDYGEFDFGPYLQLTNDVNTLNYQILGINATVGNTITGSFIIPPGGGFYRLNCWKILSPDPFYTDPQIFFSGGESNTVAMLNSKTNQCNFSIHQCTFSDVVFLKEGTYNYTVQGSSYQTVENNTYYLYAGVDLFGRNPLAPKTYPVGGGRLSRITNTAFSSSMPLVKKYIYDDSLKHVKFTNIPRYNYEFTPGRTTPEGGGTLCFDCNNYSTVREVSVKPMIGPVIEYGHVTELDDDNGSGGRIEKYFGFSENLGGSNHHPVTAPLNINWTSGILNKKILYKSGEENPIEKDTTFNFMDYTNTQINGLRVGYNRYCVKTDLRTYFIITTPLISTPFQPLYSAKDMIFPSGIVSSREDYEYNFLKHQKPVVIKTNNSSEQINIKKIKYVFDYDNLAIASGAEATGLQFLQSKFMNLPVEELSVKTINNVEYVVGGILKIYKQNQSVIDKIYELQVTDPILLSGFSISNIDNSGLFSLDNRYKLKLIFDKYDVTNSNILEQHIVNGVKTCFLWSYNKELVIAEIKNIDYNIIESILTAPVIEAFSNQLNPDKAAIDGLLAPLKTNFPNGQIISYVHKPLVGILSQTDVKGIATYYEYDASQRLKCIKDQDGHVIKSYDYHYKTN